MSELHLDFTIDKTAQTVSVIRSFEANLELVWDAFTKQEILDQWWAPKPWASETKSMDFKVGGRRFYAMVSPDRSQSAWQIQDYISISPNSNFKFLSVFADENETPFLPGSNWDISFSEQGGITKVSITIHNESLERMEKMLEMGFQEGFTMTLNQLAVLLETITA
jgi:uncharacterized protein YndB with AHSA1/START domain